MWIFKSLFFLVVFTCHCFDISYATQDHDVSVCLPSRKEEWLEQKQFFEENGYLWIRNFFSPEQVKLLHGWADEINVASQSILTPMRTAKSSQPNTPQLLIVVPEAGDPSQVCRAEDMFSCYHDFHDLIEKTVTTYIGHLLGEPYVPFKDKINFKWPGGGAFSPHQDFVAYEAFGPREHVTAMVSIDCATLENGCLQVARNWKQISEELSEINPEQYIKDRIVLPYIVGGKEHGMIESQYVEKILWLTLETSPCDLVIFNSFLPHYSEPNHSDTSRRAMFITHNKVSQGDHRIAYYEAKRQDPENPVFHIGTPTKARGK